MILGASALAFVPEWYYDYSSRLDDEPAGTRKGGSPPMRRD